MEGRRLKRPVVYAMYGIAFALVLTSLYVMSMQSKETFRSEDIPPTYVSKVIFDDTLSVIRETPTNDKVFIKPFVAENVKINKNFYDDTEENQESAIIYYENTYMQSTGIEYASSEPFDVVATYGGTVTAVTEDELLGNIIQITHENGFVSNYESVSDIRVKVNDIVEGGTVIAKSGNANLFKDVENGLYYELVLDSKNINPLLSYDKSIAEIKG